MKRRILFTTDPLKVRSLYLSSSVEEKEEERRKEEKRRLDRIISCTRCNRSFKYGEMKRSGQSWDMGIYCITCLEYFLQEHKRNCPQCHTDYFSRQAKRLCDKCRMKDNQAEKRVVERHLRKARKSNREANLTIEQWLTTLQYFEGKCAYCQKQPYEVLEHYI